MASGDTTWRDALLLAAPRIAGLRVRPLTAWHCHVAQMIDLRLDWSDDVGPTPGDIAQAIAICRTRYTPEYSGIPVASWWLTRVYLPIRWLFRDWRRDGLSFVRYVEAYRRYPQIVRTPEKAGDPLGCPQFYAMAVDVASRLPSMPLAEALNMPLIALYCLRASILELNGGPACAWRTSEHPDEISEALKQAQAAIDRFKAAKGAGNGKP
ncbi:MAG: hypothetical protein WC736_15320 [Gallionella sp.]|jgi:hypothetical protein